MNAAQLPQAVRDGIVRGLSIVGLAGIASIHPHSGRRRVTSGAVLALLTVSLATVSAAAVASRQATAADVLVRLRSAAVGRSSAVLSEAGGTLVAEELDLWKLPARSAARTLRTLEASGSVAFSERETAYVAGVSSVAVSDPLVPQQWWRSAIGVDGLTSPGPGVPVWLVNSGVDLGHPEFAGRPNLFTLNRQEPQPFGGVHGTSVASVVGAQENGVGIVGVYPDAVIRSWDAATGSRHRAHVQRDRERDPRVLTAGRSVINLSLGGRDPDAAIKAAVNLAVARGSLVVAASGTTVRGSPLDFPAAFPHVLTVAATQEDGSVAPFSERVALRQPGSTRRADTGRDPRPGDGRADLGARGRDELRRTPRLRCRCLALDGSPVPRRRTGGPDPTQQRDRHRRARPRRGERIRASRRSPAALSLPAPVRDRSEPNDDVDDVTRVARATTALLPSQAERRLPTAQVAASTRPKTPATCTASGCPKGRRYERASPPAPGSLSSSSDQLPAPSRATCHVPIVSRPAPRHRQARRSRTATRPPHGSYSSSSRQPPRTDYLHAVSQHSIVLTAPWPTSLRRRGRTRVARRCKTRPNPRSDDTLNPTSTAFRMIDPSSRSW